MGSMESGRWKFTGITESMGIADSDMTEILLKSAKYSEKVHWGWYTRQESGEGKNIFW